MKSYGTTHRGLVREHNEDHLYCRDTQVGILDNLFIVADGMGGHQGGEVASKYCTEHISDYIQGIQDPMPISVLFEEAIAYANEKIYEMGLTNDQLMGMGTTVVVCTITEGHVHVGNVGDSRLYVVDEKLKQITVDHSVVEELFQAGHITEVEKHHHPDKNMITRAVGVEGRVQMDYFAVPTEGISGVMLCTDGLTKMLTDLEIENCFNKESEVNALVEKLVSTAIERGGRDNITIIVVDLEREVQQ